uniref:NET domain-containing protein n=1 Tax=viral metagenome TaxID=1070528 RepID=A0A6C0JWW4_9ZZZZ
MNRLRLEKLKEKIDSLDSNEHRQIYNIIKNSKVDFHSTKTQQGILVTADSLEPKTIEDIEKYVLFCIDQKKRIHEDMKIRKEYERMV